jgi:magnesium transporter
MKVLTALSVSLLPATLLASIFGMNAKWIPFADEPYGFWIIIGIMAAVIFSILKFFKNKGWLQ